MGRRKATAIAPHVGRPYTLNMFEAKLLSSRKIDFWALHKILAYGVRSWTTFGEIGGAEVAFELYRWMTTNVTGDNWNRWSWPTRWVRESLAMNMSSRVNCGGQRPDEITPFRCSYDRHQDARPATGWRHELASRFAYALLDEGKMAEWRATMKIDLAKPRRVPIVTYDRVPPPERMALRTSSGEHLGWKPNYGGPGTNECFPGEIDKLFGLATPKPRQLREQLNPYHDDARNLQAVLLWPTKDGWVANVEYGVDGSSWDSDCRLDFLDEAEHAKDMTWCRQRRDEPFSQFVYRAHDQFEALLEPVAEVKR